MFANTSEPKQTAVDNNESYTDTELEPLRSEVERAINSLKDRKSPGCDEITAERIKASGEAGITYYHNICTKIWKTGEWPEEWKRAVCLENFEYLGSKIKGNGKCSNEIKRRTAMAAGQLKKMEKNLERTR